MEVGNPETGESDPVKQRDTLLAHMLAIKSGWVQTRMADRPLDGLKAFSTRIATNINDLPRTSPHGSDSEHD